jgi:hypothetical protein
MAEHARDEQITDVALRRVPVTPGPRGPQAAAPLVVRYGTDIKGYVLSLCDKLKQ